MAFGARRVLTVDHTKCGTADSSNFPVLIDTSALDSALKNSLRTVANGGSVQNSSGYDVYFYSNASLTTRLAAERVAYNATTGVGEWWVKIPILSASSDAIIHIAYGDSSISSDPNSDGTYGTTSVWDSNYKGVWHFGDGSTLSAADSTGNKNGTIIGSAPAITGQIDGGVSFNGTSQAIQIPTLTIPTTGTFSCWWKPSTNFTTNDWPIFTVRVSGSPLQAFDVFPASNGHMYGGWYNNGNDDRAEWIISGLSAGTWYYVTVTWTNGGTTELRINNVSKAASASLDATWDTSALDGYFGKDNLTPIWADTAVDEGRLSNVVRPLSWITAEYNNQSAAGSFLSVGSEITITRPLSNVPLRSFIIQ